MSYIILLALMIWAISSIVKSASAKKAEKQRAKQIAQIKAEQSRHAQIMREYKQAQAEAKIEVQRMVALEEAQMRMKIAEAEAWRKQEAWNAKQEEINRKHDEEIAKLTFKVEQAQNDIEFLTFRLDDLEESFNAATEEALLYHSNGDTVREERAKRKIITLQNQIHTTENKLNKAKFDKDMAERKLA